MFEGSERILKLVSLGLGALLFLQLVRVVARSRPLAHVTIPALPTLAATNAPTSGDRTNAAPRPQSTNRPVEVAGSNSAPQGTNAGLSRSSNQPAGKEVIQTAPATNRAAPVKASETAVLTTNSAPGHAGLNSASNALQGADSSGAGSNSAARVSAKAGTNITARSEPGAGIAKAKPPSGPPPMGMQPFPGGAPRGMGPPLPPAIQARVDRIVDSEIFAPVMRPLPMALLGIAGNIAFLRAPNGQTGLVKEKEELGGIKLLRIGINRVLVEEDGQPKELTIFSGYGSESLLPKPKEKSP